MPQYLLAVHSVEGEPAPSPELMARAYAQVDALNAEIRASGAWVFAGGLLPVSNATVVRAEDGVSEPVITDGPFTEAKEHLGGFWVLEAADLDTALEWARKGSAACMGPVEVRPFADVPAA